MSDWISREDAARIAEDHNLDIWEYSTGNRSRIGHDPVAEAIRALPAVQPVMESGHWKDHCRTNNGPDICDEPCRKCLAKPPFSHFAVQIKMTMQDEAEAQLRWIAAAAHVNETPKSEHGTANMLTPATKGGGA